MQKKIKGDEVKTYNNKHKNQTDKQMCYIWHSNCSYKTLCQMSLTDMICKIRKVKKVSYMKERDEGQWSTLYFTGVKMVDIVHLQKQA